jgi:hypothetical protein
MRAALRCVRDRARNRFPNAQWRGARRHLGSINGASPAAPSLRGDRQDNGRRAPICCTAARSRPSDAILTGIAPPSWLIYASPVRRYRVCAGRSWR